MYPILTITQIQPHRITLLPIMEIISTYTEQQHLTELYKEYYSNYNGYDSDDEDDVFPTSLRDLVTTFEPAIMAAGDVAVSGLLVMNIINNANGWGMLEEVLEGHKLQEAYTLHASTLHTSNTGGLVVSRSFEEIPITINPETANQYKQLLKIDHSFYETDEYLVLLVQDKLVIHLVLNNNKYEMIAHS
jgi:hypothetical protein